MQVSMINILLLQKYLDCQIKQTKIIQNGIRKTSTFLRIELTCIHVVLISGLTPSEPPYKQGLPLKKHKHDLKKILK